MDLPKVKLIPTISPAMLFKDRDAIWRVEVNGVLEKGDYVNHSLAVQRMCMLVLKAIDPEGYEEYYSGRLDDNRGQVHSPNASDDASSDDCW